MAMDIDVKRLIKLTDNEAVAENKHEQMCVHAFAFAVEGKMISETILAMPKQYNNATLNELHWLIAGYARGQMEYIRLTEELKHVKVNKTVH